MYFFIYPFRLYVIFEYMHQYIILIKQHNPQNYKNNGIAVRTPKTKIKILRQEKLHNPIVIRPSSTHINNSIRWQSSL